MPQFQAYSCDAISGTVIDRIPASAFPYSRMLSAGDSGSSITIPLDGTFSRTELKALTVPRARLITLERDGAVEYMGFPNGDSYTRGSASVTFPLVDWWAVAKTRGAWNHGAPNVEQWKTTIVGNLAAQASAAVIRGRDSGPALPAMGFPMTIPGFPGGTPVTRTYFGYHLETINDVLSDLMSEGLDVYTRPRWIVSGRADWLLEAGISWASGLTREFMVTAPGSPVTSFTATSDASRMTNNARYVGEGSEVDMLIRSNRNTLSPYPLMDRTTQAKNISDVDQLAALANRDLVAFGAPTSQWEFKLPGDEPCDVGDTVRLGFEGDAWIPDDWYALRVVGIKGDLVDEKTVVVQPTGGA